MKRLSLLLSSAALALAMSTGAVSAHEFLIKPGTPAGGALPFVIESTHYFMAPEEMEGLDTVKAFVLDAKGRTEVAIKAAANGKTIEGTAKPGAGAAFLLGHRLPTVWSKTPDGMLPGDKKAHPDALYSNLYEKFAKAVIGDSSVAAVTKPVGQRLEIVPQVHPSTVKVGEDLTVQILLDGKPLSTEVYATFDGFTPVGNTYAFFTETYSEGGKSGLAKIRLWHSGLWMVRVQAKIDAPADGITQAVFRSVLTFPVK